METVNQSIVGLLVSLLLSGCVTELPVTSAGGAGTEAAAARWITPVMEVDLCCSDTEVGVPDPSQFIA